jgi:hypothetical protein
MKLQGLQGLGGEINLFPPSFMGLQPQNLGQDTP